MNIEADYIVHEGEFIYVYNGDNVVAMVRPEIVNLICISEKQVLTKKEIKKD
jgi:UDP-N-acetylglucosamine pyrophosphorylase